MACHCHAARRRHGSYRHGNTLQPKCGRGIAVETWRARGLLESLANGLRVLPGRTRQNPL